MDNFTKVVVRIAIGLACILVGIMIFFAIYFKIGDTIIAGGKGDDMSLFGMGKFILSEIQLSGEEKFVDNPEGETDDLHFTASLTALDWKKRSEAGLTNASVISSMKKLESRYAYSVIEPELRQLYAEMYLVLEHYATQVPLCSNNITDIKYIAECLYVDCPEFFYHTGYEYLINKLKDNVVKVEYSPIYSFSQSDVEEMKTAINNYAINCLAGIDTAWEDFYKVQYIYEYLILYTDYDETVDYNQTICSVALYSRSVCLGYARMMQYLLQELDIQTAIVIGETKDGVSHAWNLIKIGTAYYYTDPTWGDASYLQSENEETLSMINYDYLCVTTDELSKTHLIDSSVPMPRCVFKYDNYFVRHNCFVSSIGNEQFDKAFGNAYHAGGAFSIKCSDENIFADTEKYLIEDGNIYRFMPSPSEPVRYIKNENMYTYTFFQ